MAKPRTLTGGQQSQADAVARLQAHHVHLAQRQQRGWVEPFAYGPEALDTSTREHLFKLHDTPHEDDCGLDSRGYPRMTPQMEVRMSQAGNQARQWVSVRRVALAMGITKETLTKGLKDESIPVQQPGGRFGQERIELTAVDHYLTVCGYTDAQRSDLMTYLKHAKSA